MSTVGSLRELVTFRELLFALTRREIQVRYAQSYLGVAWAVIHPFAFMVVFTVVLKRIGGISTEGLPGPIYYYAGLLPWTLFATGFQQGTQSVVSNANLVRKAYFPREAFPIASVAASLVDHAVAFVVYLFLMAIYRVPPTWHLVLLVPVVGVTCLLSLGAGLLLAPVNVKYRDIRHVLPLLIQLLMFATVIIPFSQVTGTPYEWLFRLNPLMGPVQAYRDLTAHHELRQIGLLAWSVGFGVVLLLFAYWRFKRAERTFADII